MENAILPLQHLRQLLQMEHDAEKEEYRTQTERMSIARKVRRGICWWPLTVGRTYYNSLNQLVIEVFRDASDDDDIDHNFEYGRPIIFFQNAENGTQLLPITGQVSYVDGNRMVASIPSSQAAITLQNTPQLGVQLYFDETSYRTMFHALDEALKDRDGRMAYLREVFAGQRAPQYFSFSPMRFPWLNATQEKAVNEVLRAKDVAIVHGPPGTGKTTTLVEAIHETLRRETQVLVCAQSNMAVDWISEKLTDYGIPVLRIGNPTRVNDKMLAFTYERQFENHPDYPQLWALRNAIRQVREQKGKSGSTHQKLARLRERATELEMRISASLFDQARVVACTLIGSASRLLVGKKFPTVFIDEAAQALEPACWVALRRAHRIVLAGDHQQLPPTVKCYEAQKSGLGITLMERIVRNVPQAVTLLQVQYRMNEHIMRFSSDWFYAGQVKSDASVQHRSILDLDTPVEWIDTALQPDEDAFSEAFVGENHGRINKAEAQLSLTTLENYVKKIGLQRFRDERLDIGVISPYRVQAQYLRHLIKQSETLRPLRKSIAVNTVDGFQGQERDIILISLVRSNANGQIGFLSDLRRMNVAMTRARMKLLVIGNAETLSHHTFYKKLKEYVDGLKNNPSDFQEQRS